MNHRHLLPGESRFCLLTCPPIRERGKLWFDPSAHFDSPPPSCHLSECPPQKWHTHLRQRKIERGPLIIPVQADNSRGSCRPRRHVGEAGNDHVKYCLPYCISLLVFLVFAMASNEEPETKATSHPSSNESNRDEPQARPDSQPNGQVRTSPLPVNIITRLTIVSAPVV